MALNHQVKVKIVSLKNHNLTSLDQVEIDPTCNAIDLSNNPIKELGNIGEFPDLMYLICKNTQISSFRGSPFKCEIANASFIQSPISDQPYFKLNATIAFGPSLTLLNNQYISPEDREYAHYFSSSCRSLLFQGFLIQKVTETTSLYVIELINIYSKRTKIVKVPFSRPKKEVILLHKNKVKIPLYYPINHKEQLRQHEIQFQKVSRFNPYYPPPFSTSYLLEH